jgi:hypothetical protein
MKKTEFVTFKNSFRANAFRARFVVPRLKKVHEKNFRVSAHPKTWVFIYLEMNHFDQFSGSLGIPIIFQ